VKAATSIVVFPSAAAVEGDETEEVVLVGSDAFPLLIAIGATL